MRPRFFLLPQRSRFGGSSRYFEHVRKLYRRFSRGFWNKFWRKNESFQTIPTRLWDSFFSKAALRKCSKYLKGLPDLDFFVSKKSQPQDIPIRLHVRKSKKSWDFQRMKLKIGLEYSDKSSCFELKLFWNASTETFG